MVGIFLEPSGKLFPSQPPGPFCLSRRRRRRPSCESRAAPADLRGLERSGSCARWRRPAALRPAAGTGGGSPSAPRPPPPPRLGDRGAPHPSPPAPSPDSSARGGRAASAVRAPPGWGGSPRPPAAAEIPADAPEPAAACAGLQGRPTSPLILPVRVRRGDWTPEAPHSGQVRGKGRVLWGERGRGADSHSSLSRALRQPHAPCFSHRSWGKHRLPKFGKGTKSALSFGLPSAEGAREAWRGSSLR